LNNLYIEEKFYVIKFNYIQTKKKNAELNNINSSLLTLKIEVIIFMSNLNENLTRLSNARNNIISIINEMGGTAGNLDGFEDFPADIATISTSASADGHKVVVTTLAGATVTLSKTGATYTGVANNSGVANINNVAAGTYTVTASKTSNGFTANSDSTTVTVQDHMATEDTFATISITATDDCDITINDGTNSETISYTIGDSITQYISNNTDWTISTEIDNTPISKSVSVSGYSNYPVLLMPGDWQYFRNLVRAGIAEQYFPVGTILYDDWDNNNSTAFRVVSYDQYFDSDLTALGYNHSVTLFEEYLDENIVYDTSEGLLNLTKQLPNDSYYIYLSGGTYYRFGFDTSVPNGGQLCMNSGLIKGYSTKTNTVPLFEVSYRTSSSSGTGYKSLGTMYGNSTSNQSDYGLFNALNMATYGNSNYYESNVRQLLNSTTSSSWYTPTTAYDRPANTSLQGKLYRLNNNFVNVLASPEITSIASPGEQLPALDGKTFTSGQIYTFKDKLFLPSPMDLGLSKYEDVGSTMDFYNNADNNKRIKYKKSETTTAGYYWLRTPGDSSYDNYRVGCITSSGAINTYSACYGECGTAAVCVIQ
jgi:hypothetical protein